MAHSGGPIRPAKSLKAQLGIPSGPMDLWSFVVINLFSTASSETTELSDRVSSRWSALSNSIRWTETE